VCERENEQNGFHLYEAIVFCQKSLTLTTGSCTGLIFLFKLQIEDVSIEEIQFSTNYKRQFHSSIKYTIQYPGYVVIAWILTLLFLRKS